MGFFNSGGLITRGHGDDHRIVTRGFAVRFEFGGIRFKRESKESVLDLLAPVLKENSEELKIYSPLEVGKDEEMLIVSSVSKEIKEDVNLSTNIDHTKLSEILEEL